MSISDTTETAILKLIFQAVAWGNYADNAATSPETNIVFTLNTADPTDSGTASSSEITYTSYARVNVARTTGGFTVSGTSPTVASPVANVSFPAGTGGSGTASFFTAGKSGGGASAILFSGTVTPNIVTGSGVTPQLSTATTFTLD